MFEPVLRDLLAFLAAGGSLIGSLATLLLPVGPLLAWIAFWYFAVDWSRLGPVIRRGGWLPIATLGVLGIFVVSRLSGEQATQQIGPLSVSPIAAAIGWTLLLIAGMFYAGAAQLSRRHLRSSAR